MIDADFFEKYGYQVIDELLPNEAATAIGDYIESLYASNALKKAGIGKRDTFEVNEQLRGDFIQWINEDHKIPEVELFLVKLQEF